MANAQHNKLRNMFGPMACSAWTAVRPAETHRHAASGRVVHVADAPDATLASAVGKVVAAYSLGILRKAVCNVGGVIAVHATQPRDRRRAGGGNAP